MLIYCRGSEPLQPGHRDTKTRVSATIPLSLPFAPHSRMAKVGFGPTQLYFYGIWTWPTPKFPGAVARLRKRPVPACPSLHHGLSDFPMAPVSPPPQWLGRVCVARLSHESRSRRHRVRL